MDWDDNSPGSTVPSAYATNGLLALRATATPLFNTHGDPLLELATVPQKGRSRPTMVLTLLESHGEPREGNT